MSWPRSRLTVLATYTWIAMLGFGGIAVETIVIYPNVFYDPPASLQESVRLFAVTGPADFFPPLGATTAVFALAAMIMTWRQAEVRWWSGASLSSLVLGEWVYSMVYFWPRNDIMFEEGPAVHSAEVLRQTAIEFELGHWGRLAMSAVTATLAFVAMLRLYRVHLLARREVSV